jgi:hypothetical protein
MYLRLRKVQASIARDYRNRPCRNGNGAFMAQLSNLLSLALRLAARICPILQPHGA